MRPAPRHTQLLRKFQVTSPLHLRTICLLILVVGGAHSVDAATLHGRLFDDQTLHPVANATIRIPAHALSFVSRDDGSFILDDLPAGEQRLVITHVGYDTLQRVVTINGHADRITLYLHPRAIESGSITVTGTPVQERVFELPQNVTVTTREQIDESRATTTAELLREEPGILVQKTTHGHGAPIIRGLIGKDVLLLYDGIRLNKPTFRFGGNQYLNTIDFESLERIEVVRGPTSVGYGSDAIGGVVNVIPQTPSLADPARIVTPGFAARYSSADEASSYHVDAASQWPRAAARLGATLKNVGDVRAGDPIGHQRPTGWDEYDINTRSTFAVSDATSLVADYLSVRQDDVPRYDRYENGKFEQFVYGPQDRDLGALRVRSVIPALRIASLRGNVSWQQEAEGRTEQRAGSSMIAYSQDDVTTWGGMLQASSLVLPSHLVSVGGEYYHDYIDSKRTETDGGTIEIARPTYPDDSKYSSAGVFIQDRWSAVHRLTVTLGLRYSCFHVQSPLGDPFGNLNDTFDDLTGAVFVSYLVRDEINLITSWSRGFRAPNLNDLVVLAFSSSGVDAPSPGLGPETSNNFEVGIKTQTARLSGELFGFYNRLTDQIDRRPGMYDGKMFFDENGNGIKDSTEFDIYQRQNVGEARIYGFEFGGVYQIADAFLARLQSSWTRGDDITNNEYLSRIPPFMMLAALRWQAGAETWFEFVARGAADQRHLSTRDKDDSRIGPNGTPGWVTFGLRAGHEFERLGLHLFLENLTDKGYKEHGSGVYSPGFGVNVTLTYRDQ